MKGTEPQGLVGQYQKAYYMCNWSPRMSEEKVWGRKN